MSVTAHSQSPAHGHSGARAATQQHLRHRDREKCGSRRDRSSGGRHSGAKRGCRVASAQEDSMDFRTSSVVPTPQHIAELERLGDRIAELSAHLDAATASLLDLIREFDQRGGWGNGFRSCAEWLSWRVGLDLGAARERVRVARALGTLPRLAQALARGELSYAKVRALTR